MATEENQANETVEDSSLPEHYIEITTGSTKHPDAKGTEEGRVEVVTTLKIGDTLKDAVEFYGEDFVFDCYQRSVVVAAQGKIRRAMDEGIPLSTVEQEFDDLDPTEKKSSITDPETLAMRAVSKMSPEQLAKFREILPELAP